MQQITLTVPCAFGVEAILKKEIKSLGYTVTQVSDGRVTFQSDLAGIARANLWLRTGDRVLWTLNQFEATTFDQLFEAIKAMPWEDYLPVDARFWVTKASSVKSTLFSTSDIQSIVKKAIVDRLGSHYGRKYFRESGVHYPLRVFVYKNQFSIDLDTSGLPLNQRGYRQGTGLAPIKETLAAAMVLLSYWNKERVLVDPFCGSGTLPIEAAMIAANIAPGLNREFQAEQWTNLIPKKIWTEAAKEANQLMDLTLDLSIQGYDQDYQVLREARANAANAYVENFIHFQERPLVELSQKQSYGVIITNPPYGKRLSDETEVKQLYKAMGKVFSQLNHWSYYIISAADDFESCYGKPADKKRKVYNGMMQTYIYQYIGPRPPRRRK